MGEIEYTNGAVRDGCGGLLRGSDRNWLGGFSRSLGSCLAFVAELWGALQGLELAYILKVGV